MTCSYCPKPATHYGEGEPVCETHIPPAAAGEYRAINPWHDHAGNPADAIAAALQLLERQTAALEGIAETLQAATLGPNYGFWTRDGGA